MNLRALFSTLLLLMPLSASAAVRPWISASLGGGMFDMTDVNEDVGNINAALAGSGLMMDRVGGGFIAGGAFGLDLGKGWSVGIGLDALSASTDVGDDSGRITYDLPAKVVRVLGRYAFAPASTGTGFAEVAVGRISTDGSVSVSITGSGSATGEFDGSGITTEASFGGLFWPAPQFGLQASLGYRHAVVKDLTVAGNPVFTADGSPYELDYSGLMLRAGLTVVLTK